MTQAAPTAFVALLSLIATNVAGYTKKTTFAALFLIGYCVGNIIGPQTFRGSSYVPAEITIIVCQGACLIDLAFIWWWCKRENARKAKLRAEPGYQKIENQVCCSHANIEYLFANLCNRNGLISRIARMLSLCIPYRNRLLQLIEELTFRRNGLSSAIPMKSGYHKSVLLNLINVSRLMRGISGRNRHGGQSNLLLSER